MNVAVVGGGLAGLTASALLAQQGAHVTVLEAAGELGGRARTTVRDGYHFNLGPHALYRSGAGARVRRRLGAEVRGGRMSPGGLRFASCGVLLPRRSLIRDGGKISRARQSGARAKDAGFLPQPLDTEGPNMKESCASSPTTHA